MNTTLKAVAIVLMSAGMVVGCTSPQTSTDDEPEVEAPDEQQDHAQVDDTEVEEATDVESKLRQAAEGQHRSADNIARNQYRNPLETLMFFGIEPGLDVVEIWPGGGWYTEVLAPVVAEEGSFTAGIFEIDEDDPEGYRTRITMDYLDFLEAEREVLGDVQTGTFAPVEIVDLGEPESAQMVLTFRNLHNAYRDELLDDVLASFYDVLEPGGVLGVVQHRAPEGSDPDETAEDGYLAEDFVIEQAEQAGFVLEESSEINANPDDTADHEEGVWSLPPSLRGGAEDPEYYEAIGESDRMTLRFVKPTESGETASDESEDEDQ